MKKYISTFGIGIVAVAMIVIPLQRPALAQEAGTTLDPSFITYMTNRIMQLREQVANLAVDVMTFIDNRDDGTGVGGFPGEDVSFSRDLWLGIDHPDVHTLQVVLNAHPSILVATAGPGSPGNETTYYGPRTQQAVSTYQALYHDAILEPVGIDFPTGFFGPSTRAHLNMWIEDGGLLPPATPTPTASPSPSPSPTTTVSPTPTPTASVSPGATDFNIETMNARLYENDQLGFSLVIPDEMNVMQVDSRVRFQLLGATQPDNTEIADGVSMVIRQIELGANESMDDIIEEEMQSSEDIGVITRDLEPRMIAGLPGQTFTASTLGTVRNFFVEAPSANSEPMHVYHISYTAPDPDERGFDEVAQMMVNSFTFTNTAVRSGDMNILRIDSPSFDMPLSSPLTITGELPGNWFNNQEAMMQLRDTNGVILSNSTLSTNEDTDTNAFVGFTGNATFTTPSIPVGILVIERANPTGADENEDRIQVPVIFE